MKTDVFYCWKLSASTVILLAAISFSAHGQTETSELKAFEKSIEKAVVETNLSFLRDAYADDFFFKHGTGLIDDKNSWLKSVEDARGQFLSRVVDSVEVDLHKGIGVTNGKITVTRKSGNGQRMYMIRYVRVYARQKNQWKLVSHRTVFEKDY